MRKGNNGTLEHWNIVQKTLDSSKGLAASWVFALRRGYESADGFHCDQPILPGGGQPMGFTVFNPSYRVETMKPSFNPLTQPRPRRVNLSHQGRGEKRNRGFGGGSTSGRICSSTVCTLFLLHLLVEPDFYQRPPVNTYLLADFIDVFHQRFQDWVMTSLSRPPFGKP